MKTYLTVILFVRLLLSAAMAEPSPTGDDVYRACQAYLNKSERHTVSNMLCYWYVTPCDCKTQADEIPGVCLSHDDDESTLIELVLHGLEQNPTLLRENAQLAVNTILSQHYPCDEEPE